MPPAPDAHRTILIVDDEAPLRGVLARQLRAAGFRILEAGNGSEALAVLECRGRPVDLVLADVVMPGMNGTELADRLLAQDPAQPIVLMSAYAPSGMVEVGSGRRVSMLRKPFDVAALIDSVERAVAQTPTEG
ncbi:MAG TPA: response regulator [Gemmatimonadales bacterium]|jgi:two-component system cell cycle sensor histidine kinase/response regulator CckA|nr:response regulator [Gemmatimonadales bacterium]